jgi:hypothetical protein
VDEAGLWLAQETDLHVQVVGLADGQEFGDDQVELFVGERGVALVVAESGDVALMAIESQVSAMGFAPLAPVPGVLLFGDHRRWSVAGG